MPKTETIDMTPTWEGMLPVYIAVIENGSFEGQRIAREELKRMAKLADAYVATTRKPAPLGADENIGSVKS